MRGGITLAMQQNEIDVSVVIPCLNEAVHLRQCAEVLLRTLGQLRYESEVIFVDDGSIDQTPNMLQEIRANWPQCRVITHDRNRGRGAAFKTGFSAACGRVVGFIDIDLQIPAHYIAPM